MKLFSAESEQTAVLHVQEARIDVHNASELSKGIDAWLAAAKPRIVVDLSAVSFVDSSGLSALIFGHKRATARGGVLMLSGAQPQVMSLLELTGLDRVFQVFPGVPEAIEHLG